MSPSATAQVDPTPPPAPQQPSGGLDRYFKISERGSSVAREVRGGFATFFAMAYIIVLNPIILGSAKDMYGHQLDYGQLVTATVLTAAFTTLLMGVIGNVPIALAAGDLTVIVPEGVDVNADVNIGAGEITWDVDGEQRSQDGVAIDDGNNFSTGSADPELSLQIRVGAGQVLIIDADPSEAPVPPVAPAPPASPGEETP